MFFIQPDQNEVEECLSVWDWLDIGDKQAFAVTVFGDVFLRDDSGIWFLDTMEGSLQLAAKNQEQLEKLLNTEEGQVHYLASELVAQAQELGMQLGEGQCYSFAMPPVLGGEIEVENVIVQGFSVALSIAGQVHRKVLDTPEGTAIEDVTVDI